MGFRKLTHCNILVFISFFILMITSFKPSSSETHNIDNSLDTFIRDYVNNQIALEPVKPRTGVIRNLNIPSNSSTITVSTVRLRSGSLWIRGQKISSFHIPPMIIPMPYVKRLVLITSNLSSSSPHYFSPPQGYLLASHVFGLALYNASATSFLSNTSIEFYLTSGTIRVAFDNVKNAKCVGFNKDGVVGEVLNMTAPGECSVYSQGYVGIVVPVSRHGTRGLSRRWLAGVVVVVVVVGMLSSIGVLVWRIERKKRIREMENQSEQEVAVGTMCVGQSRLPAANNYRTQPQLESEMFP